MGSGPSGTPEAGGFRIFKVTPGSPASEAGLEVFFDFIVEIKGCKLDSDQSEFYRLIQESENSRCKFVVYNTRTQASRETHVTPRRWDGKGLLGAVVRYDSLGESASQGIRILEVFPNSPAALAGLVPQKDFLLGTTELMFGNIDELIEIINLKMGTSCHLYVYNSDTESIREVAIYPNTNWGGNGAIGADIRTGMLHRIPAPRRLSGEVSGTVAQELARIAQPSSHHMVDQQGAVSSSTLENGAAKHAPRADRERATGDAAPSAAAVAEGGVACVPTPAPAPEVEPTAVSHTHASGSTPSSSCATPAAHAAPAQTTSTSPAEPAGVLAPTPSPSLVCGGGEPLDAAHEHGRPSSEKNTAWQVLPMEEEFRSGVSTPGSAATRLTEAAAKPIRAAQRAALTPLSAVVSAPGIIYELAAA